MAMVVCLGSALKLLAAMLLALSPLPHAHRSELSEDSQLGGHAVMSATPAFLRDADPTHTEKHKALCSAVTQCYCMRYTLHQMNNVCGWCESDRTPMLGNVDGPSEGTCGHWVWSYRDCPTLYCEGDWKKTVFMLDVMYPPIVFCVLWLYLSCVAKPNPEPQKPALMDTTRTRDEFAKGLLYERAKPKIDPFQVYFPYVPRLSSLLSIMLEGSVLKAVAGDAMRFGFIVSLLYTLLRFVPGLVEKQHYLVMAATLEEVKGLSATLQLSVGFLFSFYALGRVGWWWQVMDYCRCMQGRSHDLAMIIGGYTAVREIPKGSASKQVSWLESKWHFYRLHMASWIACFRGLSPDFGQITLDDMRDIGFLEEQEVKILEKSTHIRKVLLKWLAVWIEHHIEDMTVRQLAMDKLCGLRGAMASLHDACELRAPMSFEGLMYTLVLAWVSTIPFGRLHDIADRTLILDQNVMIPTFSAVCTYAFFMSMIGLLEAFKDPFGKTRDGLNAETLFLETETSVHDYFTAPVPECFDHMLISEKFTLPDAVN
eukprot:TRINITY_DN73079_c0_g1_i1.p1 TRINITY_DN73079_c0_g1~~TRINITY_DN73079_c0_g1_i1.p1  ORF type:complete len:540 (-),score=66.89 TRINITY_DN73079_c0_g1_i1:146-1765(-)